MLKDLKNTISQSAVYGLSRISFKLVAFVLFPIYSVYFSVNEYGIIVRGEIFWQLLNTVMLYAIETAIIRWYSLLADGEKRKSLIYSTFTFLLLTCFILIFISFIFPNQISLIIFNSSEYNYLVKICLILAVTESLVGIPLVILRIREKAMAYTIFVILETVLSLCLQIYFITSTEQKTAGVFFAKVLASGTILLFLLPVIVKAINFKFDYKLLREILKFIFPLMLASLVSALFYNQDRFILGYLTDSKEVGLYGLGNNIAGILIFLFISPFALAFPTIFWKKINDNNSARFYTKSMTYSFFVFVFGAVGLSLISPNFIKIFARNPEYWLAKNIVPIIAFSLVFYGMQVVGFMSFYHSKKTKIVLLLLVISSAINIILNLALIPVFKMYGAAISTFISFFISTLIMYSFSKRYYFIKWENYKLIITMITGIIIVLPFYLFNIESLFLSISLKLAAIISFPLILYFFNFYEEIEIISVKNYIRKIIKYGPR